MLPSGSKPAIQHHSARSDILLHLVQLYVRADRDDEAMALAEGELSRIATPEEVASAHEEIERWGLVRSANEALDALR